MQLFRSGAAFYSILPAHCYSFRHSFWTFSDILLRTHIPPAALVPADKACVCTPHHLLLFCTTASGMPLPIAPITALLAAAISFLVPRLWTFGLTGQFRYMAGRTVAAQVWAGV